MLPDVSVVIPVYGQSDLVLRLVDSIKDSPRLGEIILINDNSPEIDTTVLKTIEGVRYYENVSNQGFVDSVRRGVKKSINSYILILNSDTEAKHKHCIERMAENLDEGVS